MDAWQHGVRCASSRPVFFADTHFSGGPRGAFGSAVACGILLGVFEGFNVLLNRVFSEGQRPQMAPAPRMSDPAFLSYFLLTRDCSACTDAIHSVITHIDLHCHLMITTLYVACYHTVSLIHHSLQKSCIPMRCRRVQDCPDASILLVACLPSHTANVVDTVSWPARVSAFQNLPPKALAPPRKTIRILG